MEDQAKYEVTKKEPLNIDITRGITPRSYQELLQFAALYHKSGLAPKSFTSIEQLAIAIGMCLEIDRPILTGLQDMAVINGRVGVFGDATLAIIRSSGLMEIFEQWEEGKPYTDEWIVHTKVKRKGMNEKTDYWSWADSKRAGFDDPKTKDGRKDIWSPWTRFTRRMMYFKSRNFLLRDEFGDILKGMNTVEELQEYIDVTPIPSMKIEGNGKEPVGDIYEVKETQHGKVTDLDETPLDDSSLTKTEAEKLAEGQAKLDKKRKAEPEIIDEKTAFREKWVNLKSAGYSTYIHKNFSVIETACKRWPDLHQEMIEKWVKLYPTTEWPLTDAQNTAQVKTSQKDERQSIGDESKVHPDQASAISAGILKRKEEEKAQGNGYVRCPFNQNKAKAVKICQTCTEKERCQPYQEYLYENPPE